MPSCWWGAQKESFAGGREYRQMMKLRFGYANTRMIVNTTGRMIHMII